MFASFKVALIHAALALAVLSASVNALSVTKLLRARQGLEAREYTTNAARLKYGLALLAPRSLFQSKTGPAKRSEPSSNNSPSLTQCIQIDRASDGSFIGYIDSAPSSSSKYVVTIDYKSCLEVELPSAHTGTFKLPLTAHGGPNGTQDLGLASYYPDSAVDGADLTATGNIPGEPFQSSVWSWLGGAKNPVNASWGGSLTYPALTSSEEGSQIYLLFNKTLILFPTGTYFAVNLYFVDPPAV